MHFKLLRSTQRSGGARVEARWLSRWMLFATVGSLVAPCLTVAQDATAPRFRRLAPGVETTIPPEVLPMETVSRHSIPALRSEASLDWTPKLAAKSRTLFEMAGAAEYLRDVWCLEFTFKPLRMIEVGVPQPSGRLQNKLLWYLVYRVKNTGINLHPEAQANGTFESKPGPPASQTFVPQFVLEGHERDALGKRQFKAYLDRVIPAAVGPIQEREDRNRRLLNSAEMALIEIRLSDDRIDRSVWGVAIWEDVDSNLDFFSIYVAGLTNAYTWRDPEEPPAPGDPPGKGRKFYRKALQLNFWRPGDEIREHENEIRFGVPPGMADLYDSPEGVAHRWTFR